ncbi:Uncharacterised protein [uncultured archaeon]|nr:Uncharacterised protein [uncultured archaeon]
MTTSESFWKPSISLRRADSSSFTDSLDWLSLLVAMLSSSSKKSTHGAFFFAVANILPRAIELEPGADESSDEPLT